MTGESSPFQLVAESLALAGEQVCITREDSNSVDGYIIEVDDGIRHFRIVRGVFDGYLVKLDGDVPNLTFHVRDGKVMRDPS
jgi:hypothetical protein